MIIYTANDIEILRFSNKPDSGGSIIPVGVEVTFPVRIKVQYGDGDNEIKAGTATLRHNKTGIVADMILMSNMDNKDKALRMMKKLYPAVGMIVHGFNNSVLTNIEIYEVFLTPHKNQDRKIKKLGDRVQMKLDRKALH